VDCHGFSWVWLTGFCIFVFGNACDFVALGIAPLSIVTLLGSWSLVVNTVTAHFLLHEVVAHLDLLSIIFIVTGIVLTVRKTTLAQHSTAQHSTTQHTTAHHSTAKLVDDC